MDLKQKDRLAKLTISAVAMIGIYILIFTLMFLMKESFPVLKSVTLKELLFGLYWYPTYSPPEFGMLPLIVGSLAVTLVSSLIALPLSVMVSIFLSEVCPRAMRNFMKPMLEILGFLPSVVLGFIGMVALAPWLQNAFDLVTGLNLFNASLLLGLLIIPITGSLADDAISSVPSDIRDAAIALGATRQETITRVVLPAALPGILQACLLGMMRGIGETMVVLMAAGGAAIIPKSLFDPIRPLTSTIAAEMGETPVGSPHYHALFFAGLLLLLMTLILNFATIWIERRWRWQWR